MKALILTLAALILTGCASRQPSAAELQCIIDQAMAKKQGTSMQRLRAMKKQAQHQSEVCQ